jgi:hypothetical protein
MEVTHYEKINEKPKKYEVSHMTRLTKRWLVITGTHERKMGAWRG